MMTSNVATIIHAVSPLSMVGGAASSAPASAGSNASEASRAPRAHGEDFIEARSMRICATPSCSLSCRCSGLAGADPNGLFQISNQYLSVAATARPRDVGNGFEHRFDDRVVYRYLDFRARPVLCFIYFRHRHACTPSWAMACRISSSLKGRTIAVMIFMTYIVAMQRPCLYPLLRLTERVNQPVRRSEVQCRIRATGAALPRANTRAASQ